MKEPPERAGESPGVREALERIANATTFFADVTVKQTAECALASATVEVARAALSSPSPVSTAEAEGMGGWRPIETAPARKPIIIYGQAGVRFAYQDENGQWRNMMRMAIDYQMTHWMPLPEPPR
jgi:hypothetical protein